MQHVKIFGELEGEEGTPRRVDVHGDGTIRIELHGGKVLLGEGADKDGEVTIHVLHQDDIAATLDHDSVSLLGCTLPRVSAGLFSESYQKALKAGQVSLLADDTMNTCLQRVEEAVHNSTFNHGVKPQYNVAPPALLRTLAAQATKGEAPRKVQGSIDRDEATTGISLCGQAVSIKELRLLCEALADPATNIDLLDLQQCLDVKGKPAIPHDEIEFESEAIQRQWGTVTLEEGDEKGDKLRAAIAPVELVSVEQGFRQLAKSQLNRMDMFLAALSENNTLTSLDLSHNSLGTLPDGKKSFKQLRSAKHALEDHTSLLAVNLSGNDMGAKGTGVIVKGLVQNVHITDLDFSDNSIGDDEEEDVDEDAEADDPAFGEPLSGLEAFADLFKKNKFIRKLSLARNRIKPIDLAEEEPTDTFGEDQSFYKMLFPLRTFHRVTTLDLSGNELGAGGAYILGAALQRNKSITHLDVGECGLCPQGVAALCNHLAGGNCLKTLVLRRNNFINTKGKKAAKASAKAVSSLCTFLSSEQNQLHTLDLAYSNLGSEHATSVLDALASCTTLSVLDLSLNRLCGSSTGEYIPDALPSLAKLIHAVPIKELYLKWNFLQAAGGTLLGEALKGSQVEILDVTQNHLRGEGLSVVCAASDNVVTLRAAANGACGEAATALAALVQRASRLSILDISDNKLGTNAASTILSAVGDTSLSALNISKNMIGSNAAPLVGQAARSLHTLLAGDNDFGSEAIMKHVLPGLATNARLRTLSVWGGAGSSVACLQAATEALASNDTLLEVDLGIPLVDLQHSTADCNAFASKLYQNLKNTDFVSPAELVL